MTQQNDTAGTSTETAGTTETTRTTETPATETVRGKPKHELVRKMPSLPRHRGLRFARSVLGYDPRSEIMTESMAVRAFAARHIVETTRFLEPTQLAAVIMFAERLAGHEPDRAFLFMSDAYPRLMAHGHDAKGETAGRYQALAQVSHMLKYRALELNEYTLEVETTDEAAGRLLNVAYDTNPALAEYVEKVFAEAGFNGIAAMSAKRKALEAAETSGDKVASFLLRFAKFVSAPPLAPHEENTVDGRKAAALRLLLVCRDHDSEDVRGKANEWLSLGKHKKLALYAEDFQVPERKLKLAKEADAVDEETSGK